MNMNHSSKIRVAAIVAGAALVASGAGVAIAATGSGSGTQNSGPWGGMMNFGTSNSSATTADRRLGWGMMGGAFGAASGHTMFADLAKYLGLSSADLISKLQSGSSIAELVKTSGRTTDGLKASMLQDARTRLAASTLTAAQQSAVLDRMSDMIDDMLSGQYPAGMMGRGFGSMMGGRGMMGAGWGTNS